MNILNIMLATGKGGLEQVFVDYINAQLALGYQVHGICMPDTPYLHDLKQTNVITHTVDSRFILNPLAILKIRNIIKEVNPDIVVLCGNRPVRMTIGHTINKILGFNYPTLSIINNNRSYLKDVKYAASVSTQIQKNVSAKGVPNSYYIPNTTTMLEFKEYNDYDIPVVGVMGRLHGNKGYDVFLDAVRHLLDQNLKFKVIIAGNGEEEDKLRQKVFDLNIQHCVEFIGWVDNKNDFYDKIDIFCLSSRVEPFGIVLLEAMTRTKAVVTTDCQGPLDIFEHNVDGVIVEKENCVDLAKGLKSVIEDKAFAKKIAEKGYTKAVSKYSPETLMENLETIFDEILTIEKKGNS